MHVSEPLNNLIENIAKTIESNWDATAYTFQGHPVWFAKPGTPQDTCYLTKSPRGTMMYRTKDHQPIHGILMSQESYFTRSKSLEPAFNLAKLYLNEMMTRRGTEFFVETRKNMEAQKDANDYAKMGYNILSKMLLSDSDIPDEEILALAFFIQYIENTHQGDKHEPKKIRAKQTKGNSEEGA